MNEFMNVKQKRWVEFENVLTRVESQKLSRLSKEELDNFVSLYEQTCDDLATARSQSPGYNIEQYLNNLVIRGHRQFRSPVNQGAGALLRFFKVEFPQEVRALGGALVSSYLLFFGSLFLTFFLVLLFPSMAYELAAPETLDGMVQAYSEGHADGRSEVSDSIMAGFYIRNNVGIAFQCFAMGIFFGIGSIVTLLFNGIVIGAVGGFITASGYGENFFSFVCGHGSFELIAIVLAGATGIKIGMLLVAPGEYTRAEVLKANGVSILKVVVGTFVMLVIAAFIEGFWSPSSVPSLIKYLVALVLWVSIFLYLGLAGRQKRDLSNDDHEVLT